MGDVGMDRQSFERLYERQAEGMFRYALSLTGREDVARDVVQGIWVKIAADGDVMREVRDERALVFRMVRNAVIDRGRRDAAWRDRGERWGRDMGMVVPAVDPDEAEFVRWLEGALAELPEEQRSAVVLHLMDGMTFAEIGDVCGIPGNTAASRFRYGIDKMRRQLRPLYEEIRS